MRIAETRAVNRALRKAYGIGLCSVEELGSKAPTSNAASMSDNEVARFQQSAASNGHPRLRDRLSQLIRKHSLDPALVKQYATDFCQTPVLRDAPRERVEAFISNLEKQADSDHAALLCQLNSYAAAPEARS